MTSRWVHEKSFPCFKYFGSYYSKRETNQILGKKLIVPHLSKSSFKHRSNLESRIMPASIASNETKEARKKTEIDVMRAFDSFLRNPKNVLGVMKENKSFLRACKAYLKSSVIESDDEERVRCLKDIESWRDCYYSPEGQKVLHEIEYIKWNNRYSSPEEFIREGLTGETLRMLHKHRNVRFEIMSIVNTLVGFRVFDSLSACMTKISDIIANNEDRGERVMVWKEMRFIGGGFMSKSALRVCLDDMKGARLTWG